MIRSESYTNNLKILHEHGVRFGQPTQFTHSHLLKANELAIGLEPSEFANRRANLMSKIEEHCVKHNKPKRNLVIIPAAMKKYMTGKIPYFFRQNSDFFYLTGCLEPESVLVLWTEEDSQAKSALFMRPKNSHEELWDGPRTGVEHSISVFGVDRAFPLKDLATFIERFVSKPKAFNIWYEDEAQPNLFASLKSIQTTESPSEFLHELRVIKSESELELMRKTCRIASNAVNLTMQQSKPGANHFLQQIMKRQTNLNFYHFRRLGTSYSRPRRLSLPNGQRTIFSISARCRCRKQRKYHSLH